MEKGGDFVGWYEEHVSQEKGNRVVHYYLKCSSGGSVLAVVGTERSVRHMAYVAHDEFLKLYDSVKPKNVMFKWRSKREVVHWLNSVSSRKRPIFEASKVPMDDTFDKFNLDVSATGAGAGTDMRDCLVMGDSSNIVWIGASWACSKQLKHYSSFTRNGATIPVHSFVNVMSKEDNQYIAYLEDMYENRKGQKKVRVRWFHRSKEVMGRIHISPSTSQAKEVFITPYVQVISAECVDHLATIFIPEHYDKYVGADFSTFGEVLICFRQFCNNKVKPFNLTKLRGYYNQALFLQMDPNSSVNLNNLAEDNGDYFPVKKGKRPRSCIARQRTELSHSDLKDLNDKEQTAPGDFDISKRFKVRLPSGIKYFSSQCPPVPPFKVDEKIELLCQDSGIRGCWYQCTVLEVSRRRIKVRYDDVLDGDGSGKLEEWIPAYRVAASDKLGMRFEGRLTLRPCSPERILPEDCILEIGTPVDVWWSDGWWEGVVTGLENFENGSLQLYFPGEEFFRVMPKKNLRKSRDWFENQWVEIEAKPDISSVIASVSPGTKLSTCPTAMKSAESASGSEISAREPFDSEHERDGNKTTTADDDDSKLRKRSRTEDENVEDGDADAGDADGVTNCNDEGGYTESVMKNEGLVTAGQTCGVVVAS